jgi:hypothetical protein
VISTFLLFLFQLTGLLNSTCEHGMQLTRLQEVERRIGQSIRDGDHGCVFFRDVFSFK